MNNILSNKYVLPFSIAAVVLVIGGAFVFSQMNQNPAQSQPEPQPTPSPSPSPTSTPVSLTVPEIPEDWQAYRNEDLGFEVKYPKEWTYKEEYLPGFNGYSGVKFFDGIKYLLTITRSLTPFGHELFCYDNYPHCNATDVTEIYSAENGTWITGPEYMIKKIENLEIAGNPAVRYTTDINSSVEVVAVKQGEATYQFFLGSLENEINSNRMLFDAILTTFQFMK